ncbi:hypothetical protein MBLNU230_g1915t1 [Neophaeotheca triangularis]
MHEIITLQFGQQANYVGTHYWNTQESYFTYSGEDESPVNHDISFRPGIGADGSDTYTPRTLIYDLKGAFGTLRRENALYELQNEEETNRQGPWSSGATPLRLPPIAPSPYQQALDQGLAPPQLTTETVRFWSDFNHIFYHPRSIVHLHDYELNSSLMPFEKWQTGEELFDELDREHDLLDRDLRPFLEECDQVQAIQVLSGVDDAWGGFASKYLERIADDLGKGCRWLWGLEDDKTGPRERRALQAANTAQSIYTTRETVSMYVPLTNSPAPLPSYTSLDTSSRWHTSALQAMLMETATLPSRLRTREPAHTSLDHTELALSTTGNRRIAAASLSAEPPTPQNRSASPPLPNGHATDTRISQTLQSTTLANHTTATQNLDISLLPPAPTAHHRPRHIFTTTHIHRTHHPNPTSQTPIPTLTQNPPLLFPLLPSCPRLFTFPTSNPTSPANLAVKADLSTTTEVRDFLAHLRSLAGRALGVGVEEREALAEGLAGLEGEYVEGWSDGGSESGSGGEDED